MPTLIWYGSNVFRLVAVTFMSWALVAQFMSLADEVNSLTGNSNTASTPTLSTAPSITQWGVVGAITLPPTPTKLAALSPTTSSASFVAMPVVPALPDIPEVPTPTTAAPRRTTPAAEAVEVPGALKPLVPLGDLKRRYIVRRLSYQRRANSLTTAVADLTSAGSQPGELRRSDLVAWIAISRLLLAGFLGIAIVAQVGLPEMFLYKHLSWLGPQSTPVTLGAIQAFCSVEVLRNSAKEVNLIPAYAVLAIGGLNILIGLMLLYLGRNLPKIPPPPLCFNHSTRLLVWTPDPPCYRQLSQPRLPIHSAHPSDVEYAEDRIRSNAHEIGLDSSDEEEKQPEAPRVIQGVRAMTAEEDVSRGGYPTFAGSDIGQPGRNVPAGKIEMDQWGAPTGLTREEDAARNQPGTETQHEKRHGDLRRPKPRRYHSPSLHLQREAAEDSLYSAIQADLAGSPRPQDTVSRSSRKKRMSSVPGRSELQRVPSTTSEDSAYGGIFKAGKATYRKSIDQAAKDFGQHFPLPPSRNRSTEVKPATQEHAKLPKGRRAPSAYLARGPLSPPEIIRSPLTTRSRPPPSHPATVDTQSLEVIHDDAKSTPNTPGTAKTPLSTPSPVSAQIAHAQHGQVVAGQLYRRQIFTSPEPLTPEKVESVKPVRARSQSISGPPTNQYLPVSSMKRATSVHASQGPKGVRFDLSTVEDQPEEVPKTAPPGGLRIPGTDFHIPLPAMSSPAPSRRQSLVSLSDNRPVSGLSLTVMMEKLEQDMMAAAPKRTWYTGSGSGRTT